MFAASPSSSEPPEPTQGFLNVNAPTTGGKQFWCDQLLFHDWRIQQNVVTGHYRLLDGKDKRHAWGTFAHCRQKLDEIRRDQQLPAMSGKAVVVLHGLGRTRSSMNKMARYLGEHGGYTVVSVTYASTRRDIAAHAKALHQIIDNLDGIEEINFVAHSLGNVIIRHYLGDRTDRKNGRQGDPRIGRIVMLAPPNNGAQLAVRLKDNPLAKAILGRSTQELSDGWKELETRLATPQADFGVIAGGKGKGKGRNPLLEGDDDLVVAVGETKLPGARDFMIAPVLHTFIMNDKEVQEATLRFLEHGHFISEEKRQPIK